jgi:hypothetical protein
LTAYSYMILLAELSVQASKEVIYILVKKQT